MVKKTSEQLRKEIASLKKKNFQKARQLIKKQEEIDERKSLEKELKELKRSGAYRHLKKLSKKRLTAKQKDKIKQGGARAVQATKTTFNILGKIVRKIDKIQL